jgi:hypothetical protein
MYWLYTVFFAIFIGVDDVLLNNKFAFLFKVDLLSMKVVKLLKLSDLLKFELLSLIFDKINVVLKF